MDMKFFKILFVSLVRSLVPLPIDAINIFNVYLNLNV